MIVMTFTLLQYALLYFLVTDRDIRYFLLMLGVITSVNLMQYGDPFIYQRLIIYDLGYITASFLLKDKEKTIGITSICMASVLINLYEMVSYYQTEFYAVHGLINNIMIQAICLISCVGCKWRDLCKKTHMRK